MSAKKISKVNTHVVDILGNVKGRDQPIMLMKKAHELVSTLPTKVFSDDDVVFFDPFCKAGEILLACAFNSCVHKSKKGILQDVEAVQRELYFSKKYYGLAPDERHHRLSLRTFLGNENSHKKEFNHIIKNGNYLSEEDGKLDERKYQREFDQMVDYIKKQTGKKKIIAVGNPPYQESDGGFGKSANNIYQHFTNSLINKDEIREFTLVIPARWFAGGRGLKSFREHMIGSVNLKKLIYFSKANDVFPSVDINGGICFLNYDKEYEGQTEFISNESSISISLNEYDIIPDDPKSFPIIKKVLSNWDGEFLGQVAWSSKPFGLRTFYFDKNQSLNSDDKSAIKCKSKNGYKFADKNHVSRNKDKINYWKVICPKAAGGSKGKRRSTIPVSVIDILEPGVISTETYNVLKVFKSKKEAINFSNYLKTDFARYMVGLRKITQDVPPDRWNWLPLICSKEKWSDDKLFKLFAFNDEEKKHIQMKVREWS